MSRIARDATRADMPRAPRPPADEWWAWVQGFGAWLLASAATLGALVFGEIS